MAEQIKLQEPPKYDFGTKPKYDFNLGKPQQTELTPQDIQTASQQMSNFAKTATSIKTQPTIDATNIGTVPVNLPVQNQDTNDYDAIIAGALASAPTTSTTPSGAIVNNKTGEIVSEPQAKEEAQPSETKNLYDTIKDQITGGTFFGDAPVKTDIAGIQAQAGIPEKQKEVNDLTSQLNAINAEAEVGKLRTIGQGRGIPQAILGGQQAQLERERAIRALPIAAQLSAAQGNLQSAQGYVDQALSLEKDYQTRLTTYNNQRLEAVWEIASAEEKQRLEELKAQNDNEQAEFDRLHDLKNKVMKEAMANGQYNLISSIMGATTEDGITSIASQITPQVDELKQLQIQKARQDLAKAQGEADGVQGGEFALAESRNNVDEVTGLLNDKYLGKAVGTSAFGRISFFESLTAGKGTYLGKIDSMLSQLSLESLINAKERGATFGALSTNEMRILSAAATALNSENIAVREEGKGDKVGKLLGFKIKESKFKAELDNINYFAKLDYILKGGIPEEVGVATMEDGTMWVQNSDGSMSQLIRQ